MDKFILPNHSIRVAPLLADLRNCIKKLVKLVNEENKAKVLLIDDKRPNYGVWLIVLSFMTRKLDTLYLGSDDYDYDIKDFEISFLVRKENRDASY